MKKVYNENFIESFDKEEKPLALITNKEAEVFLLGLNALVNQGSGTSKINNMINELNYLLTIKK